MTHLINRVFLVLILTGYSVFFLHSHWPRRTVQSAGEKKTASGNYDSEAKPVVEKKPVLLPGTGVLIKNGKDTFEDENWKWYHRHPKSSREQDKRMRSPLGKSNNGLWFEGPKRGTPDVVKRVELPAPGWKVVSMACSLRRYEREFRDDLPIV